jgi:KUP system potassium uptake protein
MLVYFVTLAVLGVIHILQMPSILMALNPWYAVQFFLTDKWLAFLALGSVVLAVTGSEALYSDMGHFRTRADAVLVVRFVLPCLLLNYFGQGAMILGMGDATRPKRSATRSSTWHPRCSGCRWCCSPRRPPSSPARR